mmetsp:Transcript_11388/g.30167  ORF Transcript_11388/g.30167 Transcript_11388/m.30167 type:complete len:115 (-) Transcript_11388:3931-4275(-)
MRAEYGQRSAFQLDWIDTFIFSFTHIFIYLLSTFLSLRVSFILPTHLYHTIHPPSPCPSSHLPSRYQIQCIWPSYQLIQYCITATHTIKGELLFYHPQVTRCPTSKRVASDRAS